MEEITVLHGTRNSIVPPTPAIVLRRGAIEKVVEEACKAREAFYLVFIHADMGGRALEADLEARSTRYCKAMCAICNWPPVRCITISPRHETEAWILADPQAVTEALGYLGTPDSIGLPPDANRAEQLNDSKAVLAAAMTKVSGCRRRADVRQLAPAIAQRQAIAKLRRAKSFIAFEANVLAALADLGSI
jgi:hypothetical protein